MEYCTAQRDEGPRKKIAVYHEIAIKVFSIKVAVLVYINPCFSFKNSIVGVFLTFRSSCECRDY